MPAINETPSQIAGHSDMGEGRNQLSFQEMADKIIEAQRQVNEIRRLLCGLVWMSSVLEEADQGEGDDSLCNLAQLVGVLGERGQEWTDHVNDELLTDVCHGLQALAGRGVA